MALSKGSKFSSERWPRQAVLVAILGGLLSVAASALSWSLRRTATETEFEAHSSALIRSLNQHFEDSLNSVRTLQALWRSSRSVEPEEFEQFAAVLLGNMAHVDSLLWAERVPLEERERWQLAHLTAADEIVDVSGVVATQRVTSWPVTLRHPRTPGALPIGVDLVSLPALRPYLERLQSATAAAESSIAFVPLEQDRPTHRVLLAMPVREHGASYAESVDGRVLGVVATIVRLEDLIQSARSHSPESELELHVTTTPAAPAPRGLTARDELRLAPPGWTIEVRANNAFRAERADFTPWVLLVLGLALTGSLAWRMYALEIRSRSLSRANAELYTEVAERNKVEGRLRETQRALATLVANLPGVAYRCANQKDWPMEFMSESCAALTGYPARDFLDGVVLYGRDVVHPEDSGYVWNAVQQALDRRRPFQLVYRIVTSAGQVKWVWEQGRGVWSRADELLALEGLISDITERKTAEEGLKREMRFVEAIVDSLPGNFYVFEESGRFVRWNANVEKVTGFSPLELAAMNPMDFFAGEDRERVERAVRQVFEEGRTIVDARLLHKDGGSTPFHFTGVLFSHEGARYLVGVGIDVSERERALAEQALVRAQLLHTAKLESLGVMASGVAHDFNNMLTVVLASAGLAQSSVDPSSEAHAFLQQALNASQDASEITSALLNLARGDAADRGPVDVNAVIVGLQKLLRSSVKRRVQIDYELGADLPQTSADAAQLRQLVLNLALNAGEACQDQGGSVRITTAARSYEAADLADPAFRGRKRAGPHVAIEVHDDGVGMDAATLARLCEPFFTTRVAGRGLGLAAVLGILRVHDGWLEVESTPGHGSLFRVCFPATRRPLR